MSYAALLKELVASYGDEHCCLYWDKRMEQLSSLLQQRSLLDKQLHLEVLRILSAEPLTVSMQRHLKPYYELVSLHHVAATTTSCGTVSAALNRAKQTIAAVWNLNLKRLDFKHPQCVALRLFESEEPITSDAFVNFSEAALIKLSQKKNRVKIPDLNNIVLTPMGFLYGRSALGEWLTRSLTDPQTGSALTPKELIALTEDTIDLTLLNQLIHRLYEVYESHINTVKKVAVQLYGTFKVPLDIDVELLALERKFLDNFMLPEVKQPCTIL